MSVEIVLLLLHLPPLPAPALAKMLTLVRFAQVFPDFLSHTAHTSLLAPYLNSTAFAQSKKLLIFETNTVRVLFVTIKSGGAI
ncbi:hypothetical protein B0H13DRAFT_2371734 [Mycena leptocephala]|nr:hypothetical protein B0H13DRAFT_2371734 [Mycena leptocephala]